MDVSINRGTRKNLNGWFLWKKPIEMDGLGVPLFQETTKQLIRCSNLLNQPKSIGFGHHLESGEPRIKGCILQIYLMRWEDISCGLGMAAWLKVDFENQIQRRFRDSFLQKPSCYGNGINEVAVFIPGVGEMGCPQTIQGEQLGQRWLMAMGPIV